MIGEMTTLIAVHNSEGLVGICNSNCYDAEHEECDCVCGGINHGIGRAKAVEKTRELFDHYIEGIELSREVMQLPLFSEEYLESLKNG